MTRDKKLGATFRIVFWYALFASGWILFSDRLLLLFVRDPRLLLAVSTGKGWLFVLVTSLLLAALVRRELRIRDALAAELRRGLEEKEALLKEVHHRVKNNLQIVASLLNLQGEGVRPPEHRAALKEAEARIVAMAIAHDRLYETETINRIELSAYLAALAAEAYGSMGGFGHPWEPPRLELAETEADPDLALGLGLAISDTIAEIRDRGGRLLLRLGPEASGALLLEAVGENLGPRAGTLDSGIAEALAATIGAALSREESEGRLVVRISVAAPA
ncbi:MAG: hypothetical protein JNG85_17910 [Spirochaetaceae bacterium]|nr:hypothetical protein [Spirochaetaceae bacterium]